MPSTLRDSLLLALLAGTLFFTQLGGSALWDEDEPKNAGCAAEMLEHGDWLVPTFNYELRSHKPILLYWLMLVSYHLFGVSEFSARFFSAVLGTGTVTMTYQIGRMLFDRRVGWWAGLILASALMFSVLSRAATPDAVLIFCVTASMCCFVAGLKAAGALQPASVSGPQPTWQRWTPASAGWFIGTYAAMGLAVLAKGPIGFLLPGSILGLFLLCRGWYEAGSTTPHASSRIVGVWQFTRWILAPRHLLGAAWALRPFTALAAIAVVAGPWYVAVSYSTGGAWLSGFIGTHNVQRFLHPMERHSGPIFYYVLAVLAGFLPWSVFLPISLVDSRRQLKDGHRHAVGYLLALCWFGVFFVFFSLAATKLPNYVVPMYPALALLVAVWVAPAWERVDAARCRWMAVGSGTLAALGLATAVALPIVCHLYLPGSEWLGVIGAAPLVGGGLACWWFLSRQPRRALVGMATGGLIATLLLVCVLPREISPQQDGPRLAKAARELAGDEMQLGVHGLFPPTLVFYTRQRVEIVSNQQAIQKFFARPGSPLLVARGDRLDDIQPALPADVTVLYQHRRFFRNHDLVLLGRRQPAVAGHAANHRQ